MTVAKTPPDAATLKLTRCDGLINQVQASMRGCTTQGRAARGRCDVTRCRGRRAGRSPGR